MKMTEIRTIARSQGIQPGRKDKADLIRAIQKREGNEVCFKIKKRCDQYRCSWRTSCLELEH